MRMRDGGRFLKKSVKWGWNGDGDGWGDEETRDDGRRR